MKRTLILLIGPLVSLASWGDIVEVRSIEKVPVPKSASTMQVAAISPAGDYLLLTGDDQAGLVKYDLASGSSQVLTTARGAGFGTKINSAGTQVAFQNVEFTPEHLLVRSVQTADLTTGTIATVQPQSRELQGYEFQGNALATTVERRVQTHGGSITRPVLSNSNLKLQLTTGGVTRQFTPNGDEYSYIWGSLSPNGERVLYYVSELGCFTARLDGSDIIALGELSAPEWVDDNIVVGMFDTDDGTTITSSVIILKTLGGEEQQLTGDDIIALYPHVATQAGKIAFSTLTGDIYVITVNK